jgi:V8-like Glu-specific endopeptidase
MGRLVVLPRITDELFILCFAFLARGVLMLRTSLLRLPPALLALFLAGCLAPSDGSHERLGERETFIVNGTIDNGHPGVGIVHSAGSAACTGTLIEADKVLTAAHCVLSKNPPYQYLQPINFYIGGFNGQQYTAKSVAAHPSYSGGNKSDVAVIWLNKKVTSTSPYPIAVQGQLPKTGETITMVGYGLIGENVGQFGTKRKATNVVADVWSEVFYYDGAGGTKSTVCSGDSGGPTFGIRNGKETVIGVHSTSEQGCKDRGFDMRVDTFASWITTQQVTKRTYGQLCTSGTDCLSGLCIPAGDGSNDAFCTQGCDSDPCPQADDCVNVNGAPGISKACVPNTGGQGKLGTTCTQNPECASGICVEVPSKGTICSQRCDLQTQDCPTGYSCVSSSIGGLCIPGGGAPPTKKNDGATCVADAECKSGICALHDTQRKCSAQCNPGSCSTGYDCTPVSGTNKSACIPKASPKAKLGEPCGGHADCESSLCAPTGAGSVCIELCDKQNPNCPSGFDCVPIANNDKGACVKSGPPATGGLGSPCTVHDNCDSKLCASDGTTQFCTQTCDPAKGCPAGFECRDAGGANVCAPTATQQPGGDDGGCAISSGSSGPATTLLLLWLLPLLVLVRRLR